MNLSDQVWLPYIEVQRKNKRSETINDALLQRARKFRARQEAKFGTFEI